MYAYIGCFVPLSGWECWGAGICRWGSTPRDAYDNWLEAVSA